MEKEEYKKLLIDDAEYTTLFTKKFENRKAWEKPNPRIIKTVIPGTVLEINVKEGQKVKAGKQLMILEAMKMRNVIVAPLNGVVSTIRVETGESIPKGSVMIEIA